MNGAKRLTALLAAAAIVWGCSKTVGYDTMYVLRPYVQQENGGDMESLPQIRAYAFAADTMQWTVASYEDALEGILTMRYAPAQKRSDALAVAEPYPPVDTIPASANWVQMHILLPSAMIVAVDTENRLYAYRQQAFSENVSPYMISVAFRPWKETNFYKDGEWWMFNDFYVPSEPETPEPPDSPDTPDTPDSPETPDTPDVPGTSDPDAPGGQQPETPVAPDGSETE